MSTQKKTAQKPSVEAALRKKLSEYAAALDEQQFITEQQAERLREMSDMNARLEARIASFIESAAAIRKTCVAGGVTDAESMATQRAVERLAARVADYPRMKRDLTNSISHRRTIQSVLESCGYKVEYRNNGCDLSIARTAENTDKQTAVAKKMTWQDYAVCALLSIGVFTVIGWVGKGVIALIKWLA